MKIQSLKRELELKTSNLENARKRIKGFQRQKKYLEKKVEVLEKKVKSSIVVKLLGQHLDDN